MKQLAHKTLLLSTIILLITLALPVAALADGGEDGNEFTQTVNGYQVTLVFAKPAAVGENQIHVRVSDAHNMPIPDADVELSVVKSESGQPEAAASAHGEPADMPGMDMPEHAPQPPSTGHDTMADMPGMDTPAEAPASAHDEMLMTTLEAGHESGEYSGKIAIETPDCILRVHLTVQGELTEVDFPLSIVQTQNGSGILLGFFAVNVAIVAAAFILKPKPVSVPLSKRA